MFHILLVDDHPSVGQGSKWMIEQEEDMLVTVVSSGMDALEILERETYDVMLFDLFMPVMSGLELTKRVLLKIPDASILIYTGFDISPHFNLLVEAGVTGFVCKTASKEQLITGIRCALRGEAVISKQLLRQLRRSDARITESDRSSHVISIGEKEQEILLEVARGKSNKEVAQALLMSQRSVEYNLTRLFEKLGVRSRAEAVAEAKRTGLLPSEGLL
jgi:two-component system competent response regulator ComA